MKFSKKIVSIISILAIGAVVLAGCSGNTQPGGEGSTSQNTPSASQSVNQTNGNARTLKEIKASGKVVIGVFSDKAPFGYIDSAGNYQGYDVYFANRIGKDLGVKVEFVSVEPASRVEYLKTGKVDIILANFTVTKERAQSVDFALPYMK
ncbi:MAG: transporter substrate-binding domain-containing protein, partial [Clostridiales bacterium]|nr:transporter substrate-binding domain-containing protein [Clostridiales bacterium]